MRESNRGGKRMEKEQKAGGRQRAEKIERKIKRKRERERASAARERGFKRRREW